MLYSIDSNGKRFRIQAAQNKRTLIQRPGFKCKSNFKIFLNPCVIPSLPLGHWGTKKLLFVAYLIEIEYDWT